jgi:hypothetical protein
LSFKIDHFSFGKKRDFDSIQSHYPSTDIHHPLDGFGRNATFTRRNGDKPRPFQTSFFIEAVPSVFKSSFGFLFDTEVFQLKISEETQEEVNQEPAIVFNYKIN